MRDERVRQSADDGAARPNQNVRVTRFVNVLPGQRDGHAEAFRVAVFRPRHRRRAAIVKGEVRQQAGRGVEPERRVVVYVHIRLVHAGGILVAKPAEPCIVDGLG